MLDLLGLAGSAIAIRHNQQQHRIALEHAHHWQQTQLAALALKAQTQSAIQPKCAWCGSTSRQRCCHSDKW